MWTERDGLQCLPVPRPKLLSIEGDFLGRAQATSDDGRVIGGGHAFGLESEAVLWLDRQPFYLKDYLRARIPRKETVTFRTCPGTSWRGLGAGSNCPRAR